MQQMQIQGTEIQIKEYDRYMTDGDIPSYAYQNFL